MYNNKEFEKEGGVYFYGARLYAPVIGRFAGVDSIAEKFPHVSVYNYAENEPVGHIDLWGLQKYYFSNKFVGKREGKYAHQHRVINDNTGVQARNRIGIEWSVEIASNSDLYKDPRWNALLMNNSSRVWESTEDNQVKRYLMWGNTYREKSAKDKVEYTMSLFENTLVGEDGNAFRAFMVGTTERGYERSAWLKKSDPKMRGWTRISSVHTHLYNFDISDETAKGFGYGADVQAALDLNIPVYILHVGTRHKIKKFDPVVYWQQYKAGKNHSQSVSRATSEIKKSNY